MKIIKAIIAALLLLAGTAQANTFDTDMSDLWWNPNESGWGVTITHQNEILFLTFFVYGSVGKAAWYGAPNVPYTRSTSFGSEYSGALYQTTGPWLGAFFDSKTVGGRQVGTVTFTETSVSTAVLSYTVDGVQVSKAIERQTWRTNNISGAYFGGMTYSSADCINPGPLPAERTLATTFTVNNTATSMSIVAKDSIQTCTYSGNYRQAGRLGESTGTYLCSNGTFSNNGTYVATEMEASPIGFTGRITAQAQSCSNDLRFGAVAN